MMDDDDRVPPAALAALTAEDLGPLSVYELEARRQALTAEIARTDAAIAAKSADHAAAEALFAKK